uniref:Uncharacterized protein n=1 Tax=Oryza brachyantha TaxID=4533 RepID=J3LAF3_ORYBR
MLFLCLPVWFALFFFLVLFLPLMSSVWRYSIICQIDVEMRIERQPTMIGDGSDSDEANELINDVVLREEYCCCFFLPATCQEWTLIRSVVGIYSSSVVVQCLLWCMLVYC